MTTALIYVCDLVEGEEEDHIIGHKTALFRHFFDALFRSPNKSVVKAAAVARRDYRMAAAAVIRVDFLLALTKRVCTNVDLCALRFPPECLTRFAAAR